MTFLTVPEVDVHVLETAHVEIEKEGKDTEIVIENAVADQDERRAALQEGGGDEADLETVDEFEIEKNQRQRQSKEKTSKRNLLLPMVVISCRTAGTVLKLPRPINRFVKERFCRKDGDTD